MRDAPSTRLRIRFVARPASNEFPPNVSKSSSTPTLSIPRTSAKIVARDASNSDEGFSDEWRFTEGSFFRSSLPRSVRGNSETQMICEGTMYFGNDEASWSLNESPSKEVLA